MLSRQRVKLLKDRRRSRVGTVDMKQKEKTKINKNVNKWNNTTTNQQQLQQQQKQQQQQKASTSNEMQNARTSNRIKRIDTSV